MSGRTKRPCARPGCGRLVERGYCESCASHAPKKLSERVRATAHERGYGRRWQKTTAGRLIKHPLCVDPFGEHKEFPAAAVVTDHILPHKGDMKIFWNPRNWQSLCKCCHDKKTAMEDGGFGREVVRSSQGTAVRIP